MTVTILSTSVLTWYLKNTVDGDCISNICFNFTHVSRTLEVLTVILTPTSIFALCLKRIVGTDCNLNIHFNPYPLSQQHSRCWWILKSIWSLLYLNTLQVLKNPKIDLILTVSQKHCRWWVSQHPLRSLPCISRTPEVVTVPRSLLASQV